VPTLPNTAGSEGVIKSYVLPGNKTGVMFVGSFEPDDFNGFQTDTVAAINDILASGAENLLIDLTDNGGGFVCLGLFLHNYIAGKEVGFPCV
jgi:C-terminal processing protease CtpA/Prc